ncbi:hypothetical protein LTR28_009521 [Elasticomyces elasticus]|nr:hypothetical protein LTR28_009521 [Elasticomyces elasticus]
MSTNPSFSPSKRPPSSRPPAPAKPPCTIHPSAIISDRAILTGTHPISIAENTVLHPTNGPVELGRGCIVADNAVVGMAKREADGAVGAGLVLEDDVVVESGAVVRARVVGRGTVVEVKAVVGQGVVIGEYSKITPLSTVQPNTTLPAYTVVLQGATTTTITQRTDTSTKTNPAIREMKARGHAQQLDLLRRLIPSNTAKWVT